jgi:hypothetical protein
MDSGLDAMNFREDLCKKVFPNFGWTQLPLKVQTQVRVEKVNSRILIIALTISLNRPWVILGIQSLP